MQAIILATDEVEKLQLLTDAAPASLLPIANRPVITIMLELLNRSRVKNVVVCLCRHSVMLKEYIGDGRRWGLTVEYVVQDTPLGSAGSLRLAAAQISEPFLVLAADTILDLDIEAAFEYHQSHGGIATVITQAAGRGQTDARLNCADTGRVEGVYGPSEEEAAAYRYDTGAYIFDPQVRQYLSPEIGDCHSQLLPRLLAGGEAVYGYQMEGYWNALASYAAYQEAQQVFLWSAYRRSHGEVPGVHYPQVRFPSIQGRQIKPGVWVSANSSVHPSATLVAPVCIGSGSWVGTQVELGPGTVIAPGVIIDDEATVRETTVLERTYVGRLTNASERIISGPLLIDPANDKHVTIVDSFLLAKLAKKHRQHRRHGFLRRLTALLLLTLLALSMVRR